MIPGKIVHNSRGNYNAVTIAGNNASLLSCGRFAADLRDTVKEYAAQREITDFRKEGMRLVIDIPSKEGEMTVHLISGRAAPSPCPQDWRTPKTFNWDPSVPNPFYEGCRNAFLDGLKKTPFGNTIIRFEGERDLFAVSELFPKANKHSLIFSARPFVTMLDDGFSSEWGWMLKAAGQLCVPGTPSRYFANFGQGFQGVPNVHMHVLNFAGYMPSIFPHDYQMMVMDDGTVSTFSNFRAQEEVLELIEDLKSAQGEQKAAIESLILMGLKEIEGMEQQLD